MASRGSRDRRPADASAAAALAAPAAGLAPSAPAIPAVLRARHPPPSTMARSNSMMTFRRAVRGRYRPARALVQVRPAPCLHACRLRSRKPCSPCGTTSTTPRRGSTCRSDFTDCAAVLRGEGSRRDRGARTETVCGRAFRRWKTFSSPSSPPSFPSFMQDASSLRFSVRCIVRGRGHRFASGISGRLPRRACEALTRAACGLAQADRRQHLLGFM